MSNLSKTFIALVTLGKTKTTPPKNFESQHGHPRGIEQRSEMRLCILQMAPYEVLVPEMFSWHCWERQGGAEQLLRLVLDCVSALVTSWLSYGHQGNSVVLTALSYQGISVLKVVSRKENSTDKSACAQLHIFHHHG